MASEDATQNSPYRMLSGLCPDEQCGTKLFFPAYDASIVCTNCGQRHRQNVLKNVEEVKNPEVALHNILKNLLVGNIKPKKGSDSVKVLGLSNYQCKLISPLLTRYGMHKKTGEAMLLTELGQKGTFDCKILGDRSFLLEPENINVTGYGRDNTGSMVYLKDTLECIKRTNDNEERLLPIHADGDGHCLVHAVSRALIGRELFWHALRANLKEHFTSRLDTYKALFQDFIDENEWRAIIMESDPDYIPAADESMGLRNMHIFGLANVLHRPIILLDSISGIQSCGDYTGTFLPSLCLPEECRDKDGTLRKPLCLAWSNSGRNHYIGLVGIKGRPLPTIPNWMFPKAWGVPQESIENYIEMDDQGRVTLCGDKCLQGSYLLKLVAAMEKVFIRQHGVSTCLAADYNQYVFKNSGIVGIKPEEIVAQTRRAIAEECLYRCLLCEAIMEWKLDREWLAPGGELYDLAVRIHSRLDPTKKYNFPKHGVVCCFNAEKNVLEPDADNPPVIHCHWCQGTQMRHVHKDGSVAYQNGDRTLTPAPQSKCQCGFKHYWDGREYDNLPENVPISLEWNGQLVADAVHWFQDESDPQRNSNVYQEAQNLVQRHFPGEFGSERLVQKVVDTVWRSTSKAAKPSSKKGGSPGGKKVESLDMDGVAGEKGEESDDKGQPVGVSRHHEETDASWRANSPSKIILTGPKSKTLHKEELTLSQTEKDVRKKVEEKAGTMQKRKTDELARQSQHKPKEAMKQAKMTGVESSDKPTTPVRSSPPRRPGEKRIRVSTSHGKQLTIQLGHDLKYSDLLDLLSAKLDISVDKILKIRYGFPPRELTEPLDGEEGLLPIQDGDRVSVDVKQESSAMDIGEGEEPWPTRPAHRQSWSSFEADVHGVSTTDLLHQLTHKMERSDSLDSSISSLALAASLGGKDLWKYAQTMPHLFSVGGLFYQQVARDLGLHDGKHCTLPSLPGKIFRYNAQEDRLELCLEPHGHFTVEPGIEARVTGASPSLDDLAPTFSPTQQMKQDVSSGASNVLVNKAMHFPIKHLPFTGTAHSLGGPSRPMGANHTQFCEDIKMPQDLEMPSSPRPRNPKLRAAKFNHFSQSGSQPNSIDEEDMQGEVTAPNMDERLSASVAMETDDEGYKGMESNVLGPPAESSTGDGMYRRLGPGYTVVDKQSVNDTNSSLETFQTLASKIGSLVEGSLEDSSMDSTVSDVLPAKDESSIVIATDEKEGEDISEGTKENSQRGSCDMDATGEGGGALKDIPTTQASEPCS